METMPDYFTSTGAINPALVTDYAQKVVKSFFPGENNIKISQLRKFYGDVKTLELRYTTSYKSGKDRELAFAVILPLIKLLKAKSVYAQKRKVVPETFKQWLWVNVDKINTHRDFEAFLLHFEAVVGFSYGEAPDSSN